MIAPGVKDAPFLAFLSTEKSLRELVGMLAGIAVVLFAIWALTQHGGAPT